MNCIKCDKKINEHLSQENIKIDIRGINKFSPKLQNAIKDKLNSIHNEIFKSLNSVEVCSTECYNYILYNSYLDFIKYIKFEDEMLGDSMKFSKEIEDERAKNINLQIEFIKEKIDLYK